MISLSNLIRREGSLSKPQLKKLQQWIDEDWESHDVDRGAIQLIKRLLATIDKLESAHEAAIEELEEKIIFS